MRLRVSHLHTSWERIHNNVRCLLFLLPTTTHRSGSAIEDWKPNPESFSAIYGWKLKLADYNPYSASTTRNVLPSSTLNWSPAIIQHFSLFGAVRNVFCILAPGTVCPIRLRLLLFARFGQSREKRRYCKRQKPEHLLCDHRRSIVPFVWSFHRAWRQRQDAWLSLYNPLIHLGVHHIPRMLLKHFVSWVKWHPSKACRQVLCLLSWLLWCFWYAYAIFMRAQYFDWTFFSILNFFFSTDGTHQVNTASSSRFWLVVYRARSTG